ncbi:hypothetical protein [Marinilabilia rubra]|uniref:Uncharacterized protein n=1 Tax=Marinilabilia rubra TaxID=2162893 RepID=A0A2U2B966_9BACT|nr:hypothetical protein [Marinilabilia rubra]PWD99592.1 hypothetical protein DDZ16_09075 [Marinilabilia rubra]
MSNSQDYQAKLADAKAISGDQIQTPYMPAGIYVQEAEDLARWATKDLAQLAASGLSEHYVTDIPARAGALREVQSMWAEERRDQKDAEKEWKLKAPLAYEYRDDMIDTLRYAFRKNESLLMNVSKIADGSGHADMIQDLNDSAVLARSNPEAMQAIGVDESFWQKGAQLSDEMADLRARANGEKYADNKTKELRDQMYTLLKQAVDEVKDCGKYVFRKDKDRLQGYYSRYNQKH